MGKSNDMCAQLILSLKAAVKDELAAAKSKLDVDS